MFSTFEVGWEQNNPLQTQEQIQTATSSGKRSKSYFGRHQQDLSKTQKLQQRWLGLFTVTKSETNTTYQIRDEKVIFCQNGTPQPPS